MPPRGLRTLPRPAPTVAAAPGDDGRGQKQVFRQTDRGGVRQYLRRGSRADGAVFVEPFRLARRPLAPARIQRSSSTADNASIAAQAEVDELRELGVALLREMQTILLEGVRERVSTTRSSPNFSTMSSFSR